MGRYTEYFFKITVLSCKKKSNLWKQSKIRGCAAICEKCAKNYIQQVPTVIFNAILQV